MRNGIIAMALPVALVVALTHPSLAQQWAASKIPAELMPKANAVVRNAETTLFVNDNGEAEADVSFAITILNEKGAGYNQLVEFYNKYSTISGIKGTIYDKTGKKVKSIPSNEIADYSAIQGFSLYEDNRVKAVTPEFGDYPYTVEYSYKKKLRSFFILPGWHVYPGHNIAIERSVYNLSLSASARVKFTGNGAFNITPTHSRDGKGNTTHSWVATNKPAIDHEPFAGSLHEETPVLMVAPEGFTMDGYFGSNNSWKELGDWAFRLGEGRDAVPRATKDRVVALVADAETDYEKAKRVYEFMQNKVRYVNISIGIGGWQPFPAETVENLSYGDCKALTNYMKTLLDVVGVKSNYCLVKAGSDVPNINPHFVCSQFNHAFLMIPFGADTVFLECTSQQAPFGYNGTFTDDRHILVIEKEGSYLKRTNVYGKAMNRTTGTYTFKLNDANEAKVIIAKSYVGVASEEGDYYKELKPERQREAALRRLQLQQSKINSISYTKKKVQIPEVNESIELTVAQLGQVTSSKTIVIPFNQVATLNDIKRVSNRKTGIEIRRDKLVVDTLRYELPHQFTLEQSPVPADVESEFGKYKLDIKVGKNEITFVRTLEWNKGSYKPEKYDDLFQFQRKINDFDRQVMILKPI